MDADPFWTDRHVLLTGCTQLAGSWTARLLVEAGAHVVGLVRDRVSGSELHRSRTASKIEIVRGPVEDDALVERLLADHAIQTVFHFPTPGTSRRAPTNQLRQIASVLEASRRSDQRPQVIVSSDSTSEGEEALAADLLALTYAHTHGLAVCVARSGECYGGGDLDFARLVPRTILGVLRVESPLIFAQDQVGERIYVKEAALAAMHLGRCLTHNPALTGRAFDFSSEQPVTAVDLVTCILKQMRSPLVPTIQPRLIRDNDYPQSGRSRARSELGWRPRYPLDEAVRETIGWYRTHFAVPLVRAA